MLLSLALIVLDLLFLCLGGDNMFFYVVPLFCEAVGAAVGRFIGSLVF